MDNSFNITRYHKIEFKLVSFYFIFLVFRLAHTSSLSYKYYGDIVQNDFTSGIMAYCYLHKNFLSWLVKLLSLYATYIILYFYLLKRLMQKPIKLKSVLMAVSMFIGLIVIWYICERWRYDDLFSPHHTEHDTDSGRFLTDSISSISYITGIFTVYTYLKYLLLPSINRKLPSVTALVAHDVIVAILTMLIALAFLNAPGLPDDYRILLVLLGLPAIILYAFSAFYFIPLLKAKGKGFSTYWRQFSLVAIIILAGLSLFFFLLTGLSQFLFLITLLCVAFELFIIIPACWFIYHARTKQLAEITGLRTALGQSTASLDFLRSQINPHFLFNALNTLYGTALQENAERTGEGIQKLGDMMRFMLQENMQEKIALVREVDYLHNYIGLQKLRTQASSGIVIQTEIDERLNNLQIAPMLLIPFVENAFKHGISLREPSHIKIALTTRENALRFDVYNSIHPKAENDPERDRSGIGLENVKQRLELLYPGRHELVISQNPKEFFIHLMLNL